MKNKVIRKGDVIRVKARDHGYADHTMGKTVLKLTNNGNGWTAKFPSYTSTHPTEYLSIDYDQMSYLVQAITKMTPDEKE